MATTVLALVMVASAGPDQIVGGAAQGQALGGQIQVSKRLSQEHAFDVAWSPDGRLLAVALGTDGYALWDAVAGRKLRDLRGEYERKSDHPPLFTPDGKHVIVEPIRFMDGDANAVALAFWNVETGAIDGGIRAPKRPEAYAVSVAARRLAVLFPRDQVAIYEASTWQRVASWSANPGGLVAFDMDPEGKIVAVGGIRQGPYQGEARGLIWIHDAATGRLMTTIDGAAQSNVRRLGFLGRGTLIASVSQEISLRNQQTGRAESVRDADPVRVWDVATGERVWSLGARFGSAESMVASADGRFLGLAGGAAGVGEESHYWIWDSRTGREVGELHDAGTYFGGSAFSPDGLRLAIAHARVRGNPFEILIVDLAGR